jgi:hypothetical protein
VRRATAPARGRIIASEEPNLRDYINCISPGSCGG